MIGKRHQLRYQAFDRLDILPALGRANDCKQQGAVVYLGSVNGEAPAQGRLLEEQAAPMQEH